MALGICHRLIETLASTFQKTSSLGPRSSDTSREPAQFGFGTTALAPVGGVDVDMNRVFPGRGDNADAIERFAHELIHLLRNRGSLYRSAFRQHGTGNASSAPCLPLASLPSALGYEFVESIYRRAKVLNVPVLEWCIGPGDSISGGARGHIVGRRRCCDCRGGDNIFTVDDQFCEEVFCGVLTLGWFRKECSAAAQQSSRYRERPSRKLHCRCLFYRSMPVR